MGSTGSRRIGALVLAAIVIAACDQPTLTAPGSSPTSPPPTLAPTSAAVESAEPTSDPTAAPDPTAEPCPTGTVLEVREYNDARRSCFRGQDVRIRGWLDDVDGLHGTGPGIKPYWLAYPQGGRTCDEPEPECFYALTLWHDVPPDLSPCSEEEPHCSIVFPHVPPGSELDLLPLGRWVILVGHTDDPAAERCHWVHEDDYGVDLDDAEAVRECRKQFVVTAIEETS